MPVPVSSGTIPDVNRKPNQPKPEPKPETLVPLPEAAPLLGIAYDTARKRLAAGTLRGEKHGGRWLVRVPVSHVAEGKLETVSDLKPEHPESHSGPIPDAKPEDSGSVPDQTGKDSDAVVLQLREEVAFLRQQVERQNHLLAGLIQRLPELPIGKGSDTTFTPEPAAAEVSPSRHKGMPWWRFWERWW